jgi:hypothetical protein
MRITAFLFALLCCLTVNAQKEKKQKFIVLSPALLNYYLPTPQLGYGVALNKGWSVLGEVTYGAHKDHLADKENLKIFRLSGEIKRFLHPEIHKTYVAFQSYYAYRSFHTKRGSYGTKEGRYFNYGPADIRTPALGYALKLGREESIGRKFYLDGFIGAGGRFTFCKFKTDMITELIPDGQIFPCNPHWSYGDYYFNYPKHVFDLYAGIRLGFRLP